MKALDTVYDVDFNFLLDDLQCMSWGDSAKGLRGAGSSCRLLSSPRTGLKVCCGQEDVTGSNALRSKERQDPFFFFFFFFFYISKKS